MALITNATRKVVIDHVVATLGRAPSAAELAAINALLDSDALLADVAGYLTTTATYLAKYPLGQTASEVAADILDAAIVGGVLAADIRLAAIDLIGGGLTAGTYTIATATNAVVAYLSDPANNDNADLGDIAKAFQNRAAAAEDFTLTFTLDGATVTTADLAAALEGVTSDAATLTAAKAAFAAGNKSIAAQAAVDAAAKAAADKAAADAAAAKAAEEKAAADAAAAKAAEEKAAADKAAADAAAAKAAEEKAAADKAAADAAAAKAAEEKAAADKAAADAAVSDAVTAAQTAVTAAQEAVTAAVDYDSAVAAQTAAASAVTLAGAAVVAAQAAVDAAADTDSADDNTAAATVLGTAQGLATDAGTADTNADSAFATLSSLQASVSSVDEGSTVIFTLDGGAAAAGKTYSYSITGDVGTSDITSGSMIGTVVADSNGVAIAQVTLNSDVTTEGAESLTVTMNRKTATVTVNDTSAAPAAQTDFTITAADIVTHNAIAGANQMAVTGTDSGTNSVTIQSSAVTSDGGFVYAGDADVTITSGAQGDSITVVSEGDSTITSGAGDDTITIVGGGSNTINVGAGDDTVTGGTGSDNIVMGSGETGANDVIDGGLGVDTLTISGDGNVIGVAGASLTSIENLVLDGTTLTIDEADLEALTSVSGDITTSEITADVANGATLDLSGVSLSGVKSLTADDNVTIVLNATQIGQIGAITTAAGKNLTIDTDVDGLLALGNKATPGAGGAVSVTVTDTDANILANSAAIAAAGATAVLSDTVTVAEALVALASNSGVSYNLSDTAANLANASEAVYNNAIAVTATTTATAVQATSIHALITASDATTAAANDFSAALVTLNVSDTASNLANNYTAGAIAADTVTATDAASAAEAAAIYAQDNNAVFAISDAAATISAASAGAEYDVATSITPTDALTVAQLQNINTNSDVDVATGYALSDTLANVTAATAAEQAAAANITLTDASITVAQALTVEALSNTGVNSYALSDTIGVMLAASSAVVASASSADETTDTLTVALANAYTAKYGAAVSDAALTVADTSENLTGLTAAAAADASAIDPSDTMTVAQALAIDSNATAGGATFTRGGETITDTAANVLAATADATNVVVVDDFTSITISDAASVEQVLAINADLAAETTGAAGLTAVVAGYTVTDTNANLATELLLGEVVDRAGTVVVTDAVTVAQVAALAAAYTLTDGDATLGTDITYSLADTAANVIAAAGGEEAGATSISISDTSVTVSQATSLTALANFDDVYTVSDTVANLVGETADADVARLNAAVSVTVADNVANLEAANGLTVLAAATTDTVALTDTLANLDTSRTAGTAVAAASSITISDNDLDMTDVTEVNALAAITTTSYTLVDSNADLLAAIAATGAGGANENGEITTLLNNASLITENAGALTVAEWNALDAATTTDIAAAITDTIANVAAGTAALASVEANTTALTLSDASGNVADLTTISAGAVGLAAIAGKNLVDTAANLTAAATDLYTNIGGGTVSVSDNGTVTNNASVLTKIYGAAGNTYENYNLVDTAANVAAAITANAGLVNFAQGVTLTGDDATVAEATIIQPETSMGSATAYSITDTAANLAGAGAAVLNNATNLTASDAATVAEASAINAATNGGTTSYAVVDTSANLATAVAADVAGIEGASGTVTASTAATVAEADVIAAFTKTVTYSVSDTSANLAAASSAALSEAADIASIDAATVAQATIAFNAGNSGTTTLSGVTDTAANVLTMATGANDVVTTLTVSGTTSGSDAVSIVALDTGDNITNTIVFAGISGTAAELTQLGTTVLAAVTGPVVASTMTLAEHTSLVAAVGGANVDSYSLTDSYTNLMVDTNVDGTVDGDATIAGATGVTLTDSSINVAQATAIDAINAGNVVYSIEDNDANVIAALNGGGAAEIAIENAASVTVNGVALDIQTLAAGGTNFIVGTKAEIEAMSSVLQGDQVAFEVSVSDLESESAFYSTLAANQTITVSDTAAILTGGNALLASAIHVVVTDDASVAEATTIRAVSALDDEVVYSLSDSGANLAAGAVLNNAVNITATDALTEAQAEVVADATNSGTNSYSVSAVDTTVSANPAAVDAYNGASTISITGTTGIDVTQAAAILAATNTGTTTIALVADTSANLATLTLGANDTVTALTPSNAATAAQAAAMLAIGSVTAYSLSDTAENLAAAGASVLNGATNITATGNSTVAQAAIIDAASNSGTTTFDIVDTGAAGASASPALLANDQNGAVVVDDAAAPMAAATATSLQTIDAADAGLTIAGSGGVGVYQLSDTFAALTDAANATVVSNSTGVTVTDTMTVAQAVTLEAAATADAAPTSSVSDSYLNLVINQSGADAIALGSVELTVTGTMNVAQAKVVIGYGANSESFSISGTSATVATNVADGSVTGATTVTLSTAATVAQAAAIAELSNLSGGYSISDTAANVQAALDTVNAASAGDRELIENANTLTLTTVATVGEALGDGTARGLYTVDGLGFSITDSVANLVAGLAGANSAGIAAASAINTNSTAAFTVAQAAVWTSLDNWSGYDHDADADTAGLYYISDSFTNVQAGDTALVAGAATVTATGTTGNDAINLTMHAGAINFLNDDIDNNGSDTIVNFVTATDGAGFGNTAGKLQFSESDLAGLANFAAFTGGGGIDIDGDASGALEVEFVSGAGVQTASAAEAAFLFNTTTGQLSFDEDGTGGTAAIDIVILTGVTDLAAADFSFIA